MCMVLVVLWRLMSLKKFINLNEIDAYLKEKKI